MTAVCFANATQPIRCVDGFVPDSLNVVVCCVPCFVSQFFRVASVVRDSVDACIYLRVCVVPSRPLLMSFWYAGSGTAVLELHMDPVGVVAAFNVWMCVDFISMSTCLSASIAT